MAIPPVVWRVIGAIMLIVGFFLTLTTIVALGNGLGVLEAMLLFGASALLVVYGWKLRDSGRVRSSSN